MSPYMDGPLQPVHNPQQPVHKNAEHKTEDLRAQECTENNTPEDNMGSNTGDRAEDNTEDSLGGRWPAK